MTETGDTTAAATTAAPRPQPRPGTPSAAGGIARAPGGWPLLGHFLPLRRDPLGFIGSLRAHGDLVSIRLGPLRLIVVCDPALAHRVVTDLRTFDRGGLVYERLRRAMGNGVATAAYHDHRRQRPIMQPAFHAKHMPGYAAVMQEQTAALLEGWHDGEVVDLTEEMFRLTTAVALRTLFSTALDPADAEKLRAAFEAFLRGSYTQIALPAFGRLPLPGNLRYRAGLRHWRAQVAELIARYRAAGGEQQDLMARLLAARADDGGSGSAAVDGAGTGDGAVAGEGGVAGGDGGGLTDEELSDQVATLLLAGGETTSAALNWAFYLLCTHPEVLEAATAEADRVLGGEVASWEQLPDLDLTARVIQEALRMYPPSWLLLRTTTTDTQLGRYFVPAGTQLLVSQYMLHHHPDVFPEPDRFDPDRWPAHGGSLPTAARRSYVPFGGGPTKCLGEQFASAEAVLALASILTRWAPELRDPRGARKPDSRLVLLPRRLPVRLTARAH